MVKVYHPINRIPIPEIKITDPAIMCMYFSTCLKRISEVPVYPTKTVSNMVMMVVIPNMVETANTPNQLCSEAGKISKGINTSQGPKIKIRNKIQGVSLVQSFFSSSAAVVGK